MYCLHKSKKIISLKKKRDFKKVYSQGKYAANNFFAAYALANGLQHNRIGIAVSRKVGSAVVRNRVKRRVKESYRLINVYGQTVNHDFVVIARPVSGQLAEKGTFSQINMSVNNLFEKLGKKVGFSL